VEAVRKLPQAFSDAWVKHDGHGLAMTALVAEKQGGGSLVVGQTTNAILGIPPELEG